MQGIVNHKHKYIMFYSAKAGCTSLRNLFMELHADELSQAQLGELDGYHNLNEVLPFDSDENYLDYYTFYISRNPYGRVVSAFLDQYVYARNQGVQQMLEQAPPANGLPQTFIEFLEYLKDVPDALRDSHFKTQSYFEYPTWIRTKTRILGRAFISEKILKRRTPSLLLNFYGDISGFNAHMQKVYGKVFKRNPQMLEKAHRAIASIKKMNSSFYTQDTHDNAAELTLEQLDNLVFAPKPQDFFVVPKARELVNEIYAKDFELFDYKVDQIPHKKASAELAAIPDDFDWQTYLLLAPDLQLSSVYNERTVVRHFLEFGRLENSSRFYKVEAPLGFVWQNYLAAHADLRAAGIDNQRDAIIHYLSYGINEGRETGGSKEIDNE